MKGIALLSTACCMGLGAAVAPAGDEIEQWLAAQRVDGQLVAASVARIAGPEVHVSGHGSLEGGGVPDGDTAYQIGSVTKVYTNLLLAEAVAAGELGYDSVLGGLLPEDLEYANPAVAKITLEALATHRSGLPRLPANLDLSNMVDPYADYDEGKLLAGVAMSRQGQPLGSFYAYSNFGVGLLGHLLGRADGKGYRATLERRVLSPLGLEHTGFKPGEGAARAVQAGQPVTAWGFDDALAGAGALWGSASDLATLVQAYLDHHEHRLKHALADDLRVLGPAGDFEITRVWHVARAGSQPVYWHNGSTAGFNSFVGFRPDRDEGVVLLVSGGADPTDVGLRALGVAPIKPSDAAVDQSLYGQYTLGPQFGIGIYKARGGLVAQASGQPEFAVFALGDDWYALGDVDAALHFLREDGEVKALELVQSGKSQKAPRTHPVALSQQRMQIEVDATALAAVVGDYAFAPGVRLVVTQEGRQLMAQLSGQPAFPVYPRGADRYFYKVVDAELQFERGEAGAVIAVTLHQGGVAQRAQRME